MNLPNLFQSKPNTFDVSSIKYKKLIDQQLVTKLIDYLQFSCKYLSKLGLSKIMVGMSGEINSIVASVLLKQALAKSDLALGENIIVMIFDFNTADTNNLVAFCRKFALNAYILNRQAAYHAEISACPVPERFGACHSYKQSDVLRFYQRFVSYHLFIQADNMKAGVLDTLDKSNRFLGIRPEGFYGHFMPFYSLYKSELCNLAKLLDIPAEFLKIPVCCQDLLYPDNTTLSYDQIDPVLFLLTEKQLSPEEISREHNIDLRWLKKLQSYTDKKSLITAPSQLII